MFRKRSDKIPLMLEAIMIVADLAIFGNARVGMICYWIIVAIYHMTDLIVSNEEPDKNTSKFELSEYGGKEDDTSDTRNPNGL